MFNDYSNTKYYARDTNLMYRVYAWMCLALTITAATAFFVANSPTFINMLFSGTTASTIVLVGLFIGQLALVVILTMLLIV